MGQNKHSGERAMGRWLTSSGMDQGFFCNKGNFFTRRAAPSKDNLRKLLSNTNNNTLNNNLRILINIFSLLLFMSSLRQKGYPGIPLAHSKTSSQPQPRLFMDSRVTIRRGAGVKPKLAGHSSQCVTVIMCLKVEARASRPGLKS